MQTRSEHRCYGGVQGFYEHATERSGAMRFAVYLPPQATTGTKVPALYYLAGLTCTEETFPAKAGAQRVASDLGVALVACDTSPRAFRYPGDDIDWDFGQGAGFYLDATRAPWSDSYRMASYVAHELVETIETRFPIERDRRGIFGHSMGGHGALVLALRDPDRWHAVSALAPICAPSRVPWGQKAFAGYLGDDRAAWAAWDTVALLGTGKRFPSDVLIDQGLDDKFLARELQPELLEAASSQVTIRRHAGYDHGYYFISTFIADHVRHLATALQR
jgi:S-formylglutathione hydrolase